MVVYGREVVEIREPGRLMWSGSSSSSSLAVGDLGVSYDGGYGSFFSKDGRKISVGDCALFKLAQDSPTFVGLICSLRSAKKSNLTLGVKWLYRPAEVKLVKGVALEASPNEVFYSFHWDEIPVASLLHPCKVAFLPKGAGLPAGVASFVCRRVYDITNKCLWWLSDPDFIDERQEELDKLLHRTRIIVHASVGQRQGPCSPKSPNGSGATSPPKHSPVCLHSSSSNLFSKMKGKKRDREDPSFEPIKRGRNVSWDDGYMEIARVAESGGLADSEAVAKLVRLMQPEKSQRKIDLAGRSMLAGIIAATDKLDYLRQFIQLKGLVVLDEWLQEIHKGKFGESRSVKDSDKSVENFILVLLCALFKLPVNLNALQMCNIGKSVNYLRSHKNSEIQKKARNLVDTWKKRVEAEMSVNDTKSAQAVSSTGRSRDGSHGIGGYRHSGQSSGLAVRALVAHHSSLKSSSMKLGQGDSNLKCGSIYPTIINSKGVQPKICIYGASSEAPQTVAKEEKTVGVHKEMASNRSTLVEKISHNAIDGLVNMGSVLEGNNHKLIVKIPNRVRIPAQSIVAVSIDEAPCRNNRTSSLDLSERHVESDVCLRKSGDGCGTSVAEQPQTDDIRNEAQLKKAYKSSFSLMNALIEVCVEFLEADVAMSAGDEIGINLLASVAIGEFSVIGLPAASPHRHITAVNASVNGNGDEKHLHGDDDCNISSISKINDGESGQHLDIIHEGLRRKEESHLRDNGISDEHATVPCATGRSATASSLAVINGKGADIIDEYCNQLPAACEPVTSGQEVIDKVKVASLYDEFERTALLDTTFPSNIKDGVVKTEEPKINTLIEQNSHSVSFKSESSVTDEMTATSSRTSRHLDSVNATINVENTASVEHSDQADGKGDGRVFRENGSSQIIKKQEDLGVHGADLTLMDTCCEDKVLDKKEALELQSRGTAPELRSSVVLSENLCSSTKEAKFHVERSEYSGAMAVHTASLPIKGGFDAVAKHGFDLNEDVTVDEEIHAEPTELMELPLCPGEMPHPDGVTFKQARPLLDIDLNVADENFNPDLNCEQNFVCEASLRSSGGLSLDLNKLEEEEMVQQSNSNAIRTDVSIPTTVGALPSSILTNKKAISKRDFDLNDGPTLEEVVVDQISYSQPDCNNIPLQSSFGPRYYNPNTGHVFAWNPPRTSYSVSVSPPAFPGREAFPVVGIGGGPHRIMGGPSSSMLFYPDTYRESVLSSFPAMPFQSASFQYPVIPFGSSFPHSTTSLPVGSSGYMDPAASGRISAFPSQLGGNAPSVSFQYPFVVSRPIPDVGYNGVFDRNQHVGNQGLDLNSAPGGVDLDGTDGSMPTVSRQVSVVSSQPHLEEQGMMYRLGGGIPKRKEPDGGSGMDKLNFKQSSWWR